MPLVNYNDLTEEQKSDVHAMYGSTQISKHYGWYAFWVTKDGTMTRQKGRHQLTEEGYRAYLGRAESIFKLSDLDSLPANKEKGDLRCWKPGITFHFSHE